MVGVEPMLPVRSGEARMTTMPVTPSSRRRQASSRLIVYLREIHAEWVERLRLEVGAGHPGRLWAGAELLAIPRWQVDHLVGVSHRADEFSTITLKLVSAIGHWCHEVEEALGQVTWHDLSDEAHRILASLAGEAVPHGTTACSTSG